MNKLLVLSLVFMSQFVFAADESVEDIQSPAQAVEEVNQQISVEDVKSEELKSKLESTTNCIAVIPEVTSVDIAEALSAKGFQVMGAKQAEQAKQAKQAMNEKLVSAIIFNKTSVIDSGLIYKHVIKSKLQVISDISGQKSVIAEEQLDSVRCNDLESRECIEKVENAHNEAMAKLANKVPQVNCNN